MVRALHLAGIEVILDVVFNHTAEGNGENNHDGTDANYSDNYGVEGEKDGDSQQQSAK
jgi:pullulanase/glycogen debranching enzyme